MDPSTLIQLPDGTEVSLTDLMQSRIDLQDTLRINEQMQKDLEEVGVLFQADVPMERKENAVRNVLANLGYEGDEVEGYLQASRTRAAKANAPAPDLVQPPEDDYEDEEEELVAEETPEFSGGSQKEHMSQNPNNQNFQDMDMANAMQQELQAQRAEIHKMRVRELRENLNKHLDRVVKTNPDFQNLLTASRSLRGEEGAKQAEQSLRAQLEQRALDSMQTRRSASGTFEDSWMAEEIEKAVDPLIGTFRSVIGDIDKLGRSPETVTGFNAEEILRSKPVPAPEYREGAPIGDIESQVKSYASDAIKRALASSSNESAI